MVLRNKNRGLVFCWRVFRGFLEFVCISCFVGFLRLLLLGLAWLKDLLSDF